MRNEDGNLISASSGGNTITIYMWMVVIYVISVSLFLYLREIHFWNRISIISNMPEVVHMLFDPLFVVGFVWGGWCIVPSLLVYLTKIKTRQRLVSLVLYFLASVMMGVIQTLIGFEQYSMIRFCKGVGMFLFIYGLTIGFTFTVLIAIRGVRKCIQ